MGKWNLSQAFASDASIVVGVPTVADIPSGVNVCDVPIVPAAVHPTPLLLLLSLELLASMLHVAGFPTDSVCPAAY